MPRLTLQLRIEERDALYQLAQSERRHPQQQAALLIRRSLEALGHLQTSTTSVTSLEPEQTNAAATLKGGTHDHV